CAAAVEASIGKRALIASAIGAPVPNVPVAATVGPGQLRAPRIGAAAKLVTRLARGGIALSAISLGQALITIRNIAPMRIVMAPISVADIGAVEVVIPVRIDVDVSAAPVAIAPKGAADRHADAE